MSGTLEFIIERLMANDVDLFGSDKSPVGTLMLGDSGRSERETRNGSGRNIQASHDSLPCHLTDCAFRLGPVRGEVTGIAESSCDGDIGCPMLAETTLRLYCIPNVDSVKIRLPAKATPVK